MIRTINTGVGPVHIRNDEELVAVAAAPIARPDEVPDALEAMANLTGVAHPDHIGTRPAMAATAIPGNNDREFRLYEALFGRDALFIAAYSHGRWPELSIATFEALAAIQGLAFEQAPAPELYANRLERPGRIPHETRTDDDPIAQFLAGELGWAFPYYHSDDATPLFVRDLARFAASDPSVLARIVTQRDGVDRTLLDALRAGLDHVRDSLNADHLLESERGPDNSYGNLHSYPVWQDSPDAHFLQDGALADRPAAMFEVQVYVHDALVAVSALVEQEPELAERLGVAAALRAQADSLRAAALEHFWNPAGYFATGVEMVMGSYRQLGGRKSAMGAAFDSFLLADPEYRPYVDALVATMFDPAQGIATPWGLRTLGTVDDCGRYRPDSYHNGSIWLFDNHAIAVGLRRHDWHGLASWIDDTLIEICHTLAMYPEFIRGDSAERPLITEYTVDVDAKRPDDGTFRNRVAQPPQLVQGWTLAAYLDATHQRERMPRQAMDAQRQREEVAMIAALGARTRGADGPPLGR